MKYYHWVWHIVCYSLLFCTAMAIIYALADLPQLALGLIQQGFFNSLQAATASGHTQISLTIWLLLILFFLCNQILPTINIPFNSILAYIDFSITTLVQRNILEHILKPFRKQSAKDGGVFVHEAAGAAISTFRDDTEMALTTLIDLINVSSYSVFALAAFVILLRTNPLITLLVFVPLTGIVALVERMRKHITRYRAASREATSTLTSAISEIFGAVQAIQVAGAEAHVVDYFDTLNERRRSAMLKDSVLTNVLNTVTGNVVNIGTGLILVIAALSIHSNPLHTGDLALFMAYLGMITTLVQLVGIFLTRANQTNVSLERMVKLMQGAPAAQLIERKPLYLRGPEPPALPVLSAPGKTSSDKLQSLEVTDLTYHHPDSARGIEGVNLRLTRGTLTVITGRIGAGKTTCLQTLLGLLPAERGEIRWNGQSVDDPASFFVPPHSAYTAQVPHLFSDTLKDNILLGLPENVVDLPAALRLAVLERDVAILEEGLETMIGARGVKLSGGQAQRTAAARMLVRDAELLVFDDLSSALDVETEQTLWNRLFATGERTFLVVSHRRQVLQRADHILVLKDGHVASAGTLQELLENCEEMRHLWEEERKGKI